jgi:hypothetical protein
MGTRRLAVWLLLAAFALSLLPMLIIAVYDHPSADDFNYGVRTSRAWRDTGSVIKTVSAAAEMVRSYYKGWQGTFSAVFVMSLQPAVFSERLYILVPPLLILGFAASGMFLFHTVFLRVFGAEKHDAAIVTLMILFLSTQFLPSPVQAFYWFNGAFFYTGFHSLAMLAAALAFRPAPERAVSRYVLGGLTVLLSFFIGGGNYVTALTLIIVTGSLAAYRAVLRKGKYFVPALCFAAVCAGLLISAFAPGNAVRQQNLPGMEPLRAVLVSFPYAAGFASNRALHDAPFLLGALCAVPALYRIAAGCSFAFRLPGLATAFFFCVYAATFTPNLYAMSAYGDGRMLNVNYYSLVLFVFFTLFYWCGWIARRAPGQELTRDRYLAAAALFLFALACFTSVYQNRDRMTGVSALRSLVNGGAETYHAEYMARQTLYRDDAAADVEVAPFTVKPYVLFFSDIKADPDDWRNLGVAYFYDKNTVRLVPGGTEGAP